MNYIKYGILTAMLGYRLTGLGQLLPPHWHYPDLCLRGHLHICRGSGYNPVRLDKNTAGWLQNQFR